jgi:hypothetical protein
MPHTDGRWTGGTSFPGFEKFISALEFTDLAGLATQPATIATPGLVFKTIPATDASILVANLGQFLREAIYADSAYDQEQFGTAAAQPGPSSVSGTGGPLQLSQGQPPMLSSKLATVSGNYVSGPSKKGLQIDSVDVIYQVLSLAAAAATIGLTRTDFANLAAPVVTNLIALGTNGLPTAIGAQPQVTNVPVTTPAMIQALDTEILLNINLTSGATGTVKFYGVVIKGHYNFA